MSPRPSPDPFERRVLEEARARRLWEPHDLVLVGVSGGLDSVVLLNVLVALRGEGGPRVEAAHLDHMLRHPESGDDAAFVDRVCRDLGVRLHRGRVNVRLRARRRGTGIEEQGRVARHEFWRRTARRTGAACVAVAHHADDQAETLVFRLGRGAGGRGLSGMRPCVTVNGLKIVRPLLSIGRDEIRAYAARNGIRWREDASNEDLDPARNRIRHEILPGMEGVFGPSVRRSLARAADILGAEDDWLEARALDELALCRVERGVRIEPLAALDPVMLSRVLRAWTRERLGVRLDHAATRRLVRLVDPGGGARRADLGGGIRAVRVYDVLRLAPLRATPFEPVHLRLPGRAVLSGRPACRLSCRAISRGQWEALCARAGLGGDVEGVDLDATGARALLRPAHAGDRIRPLGGRGTCKLQDLFTDARAPREERPLWPVLECGGRIAWVAGLRIAHEFRVRAATGRIGLLRVVNRPKPWI